MYSSSINGIITNFDLLYKSALEIQKGVEDDLIDAQIDMIVAGHGISANIVAIQTIDSIQKTVLDIFA